jgi:hypothetical protein
VILVQKGEVEEVGLRGVEIPPSCCYRNGNSVAIETSTAVVTPYLENRKYLLCLVPSLYHKLEGLKKHLLI